MVARAPVRLDPADIPPGYLAALVRRIALAMHRLDGKPRTRGARMEYGRRAYAEICRQHGTEPIPIGAGNDKTDSAGTYRPVGASCPLRCAMHPDNGGECYALFGRVKMSQDRAHLGALSAALAAATCMLVEHMTPNPGRRWSRARLHVSGDLGTDPDDGALYVDLLCHVARIVREIVGLPEDEDLAWTYTHWDDRDPMAQLAIDLLREAGIAVRWSDPSAARPDASYVVPSAERAHTWTARTGIPATLCPAQLTDNAVPCSRCGACNRLGVAILFRPESQEATSLDARISGAA